MKCELCGATPSMEAKFCAACGGELKLPNEAGTEILRNSFAPDVPDEDANGKNGGNEPLAPSGAGLVAEVLQNPKPGRLLNLSCPVCGQIDQVQKVKTIISAGTSNTSGIGAGALLGGAGNLSDVALGGFFANTSTELTNELAGAALPNGWPVFLQQGLLAAALSLGVGFTVVTTLTGGNGLAGLIGSLAVWWLWLLVGAIWGFIKKIEFEREELGKVRAMWASCKQRLNEARFCFRDGVIFDEALSGDSAYFIQEAFRPVEDELQRMEKAGLIKRY